MRARYHSLQVISDNEEALKHVLKDACEQVHLEYSDKRVWKLLHPMVEVTTVFRTMKEMVPASKRCSFLVGH